MLGNNLYLYSVATGELVTITTDGAKNLIYNGIPDWVYEGKGAGGRGGGREGGREGAREEVREGGREGGRKGRREVRIVKESKTKRSCIFCSLQQRRYWPHTQPCGGLQMGSTCL